MGHGDLENLIFNSKFPQLFEKDSGQRAWPVASEKRRGEGESLQESYCRILNFLVPGVDRSFGPGDHRARRRLVWKI